MSRGNLSIRTRRVVLDKREKFSGQIQICPLKSGFLTFDMLNYSQTVTFRRFFMAKQITYREQEKIQNTMKLREFLSELPPYAKDYFRAKEPTTSDKTRLSYAYDLRVFLRFLQEK